MKPVHTREEMMALMPPGGIGAEIGVWKGDFSAHLLALNPRRLYLIDQWLSFPDPSNPNVHVPQAEVDEVFAQTCVRMEPHRNVCIMRMPSLEAAEVFRDFYFDWLFVDACHEYDAVKADLAAWWPKVKMNGYLCGHDYVGHVGVKRAVDEFVADHPTGASFDYMTTRDMPSFGIRKVG